MGLFTARIEGHAGASGGARYCVRGADGASHTAERAHSCLVRPEIGDRVLSVFDERGGAFILAVLTSQSADTTLSVDGSLAMEALGGRVDIVSKDGVSIATPRDLDLTSGRTTVQSGELKIGFGKLKALGEEAFTHVVQSRFVGRTIETLADSLSQTAKRALRVVSELDQWRAGQLDIAADKALHVHAANTLVTAEELVKLDGETVQLG